MTEIQSGHRSLSAFRSGALPLPPRILILPEVLGGVGETHEGPSHGVFLYGIGVTVPRSGPSLRGKAGKELLGTDQFPRPSAS